LKGGGGVCEAKIHNKRFVESAAGDKGGLPFVTGFDSNIVVTPANVKF
jgi:hypothetical protein